MNNELYKGLKDELNSLDEEGKKVNSVCALLNEKLKNKTSKDIFTITYTFYEYMCTKEEFNFIKTGEWKKFFQDNISKYLTFDIIKDNFDDIIENENLLDTILKICTDEVKQNIFKYAKIQNDFYIRTGSNKYFDVFNKISEIVEGKKVVIPEENALSNNDIEKKLNDLKEKQNDIEKKQDELNKAKEEKRNELFNNASSILGINSDSLLKKVGNEESLKIDSIQISSDLIDRLKSNDAKAASCPSSVFKKLKENIKEKIPFVKTYLDNKDIKLEIKQIDGSRVLEVKNKETVFDKIASCDNTVIRSIALSSSRKLKLFKSLVTPDREVVDSIKNAILNTNKKIIRFAKNIKAEAKETYTDLKKDVIESYNHVQQNLENTYLDDKKYIKQRVDGIKNKVSDALYNVADKIQSDKMTENGTLSNEINETRDNSKKESYFYTRDGKKVIVRAGTKVAEKEKIHTKVA